MEIKAGDRCNRNRKGCKPIEQYCDRTVDRCQECSMACSPEKLLSECEKHCKDYTRLTSSASTTSTITALGTSEQTIKYNYTAAWNILPFIIVASIILVILLMFISVFLVLIPRIHKNNRNTKRDIFQQEGEKCTQINEQDCMNEKYKSLTITTNPRHNHYISTNQIFKKRPLEHINNSSQTEHEPLCTEIDLKESKRGGSQNENATLLKKQEKSDNIAPTQSMVNEVTSAIAFRTKDVNSFDDQESLETSLKQIKEPKPTLNQHSQKIKGTESTPLISLHLEDERHAKIVGKEEKLQSWRFLNQQKGNKLNVSNGLPNFNSPERLYANVLDENKNAGKKKNKFIYEHLRKTPWVEGYYSEGHSIQVFVDLHTNNEDWAIKQLCQETGQLPSKFHIKQSTELNY